MRPHDDDRTAERNVYSLTPVDLLRPLIDSLTIELIRRNQCGLFWLTGMMDGQCLVYVMIFALILKTYHAMVVL